MNADDGAMQLGLLPNTDTPVSKLGQRQRATNNVTGIKERDLAVRTQKQILQHGSLDVDEDVQSQPNTVTTHSPTWEQSQEFIVSVVGQDVRVNFRASYFSAFGSSRGYHHFEFLGHSTSPTGYRSDFLQIEQATSSWSSPIEYAQQRAQELHAELLKKQRLQQRAIRGKQKNA